MDEEFAYLLFTFGVSLTAMVGFAFGWWRAARRVRRLEDHIFLSERRRESDDGRVEQLEQTLEALSGQMDQLANGQEFLNRVLAERLDRWPRPPIEAVRETTPH